MEYILVFLIAFTVRILPLMRADIDFDTYGHLYFAAAIKDQSVWPWQKVKLNCWGSSNIRNPFLWNWLVGNLGLFKVGRLTRYYNAFLDAIFSVFIFYAARFCTENEVSAFVAILIYLFSPLFFSRISLGARLGSFTPRVFTEICTNLLFLIGILEFGLDDWMVYTACSLLAFCVLSTSKFGVQVLLFLTPAVSFLVGNIVLPTAIFIGLTALIIVSRGEYLKVLNYQIKGSLDYFNRNRKGTMEIYNRNDFSRIKLLEGEGFQKFKSFIWLIVAVNSYSATLIKIPAVFVVNAYIIFQFFSSDASALSSFIYPSIVGTIVFFVINQKLFLFLGEAERYISHIGGFVALSCAEFFDNFETGQIFFVLIAYGIAYWIVEIIFFHKFAEQTSREKSDAVIDTYLREQTRQLVVTSFPYHNFCIYRVMMHPQHVAVFPLLTDPQIRKKFTEKYERQYPYIDLNALGGLAEATGLNLVIIDRVALRQSGFSDWVIPYEWSKVELEQDSYLVIKRI